MKEQICWSDHSGCHSSFFLVGSDSKEYPSSDFESLKSETREKELARENAVAKEIARKG
ncbi:unnamed protein product [Arabidopsis halleri]